ncbi:DUF3857 and transglutaminase domain-containing protein [Dyadobacter sp. CY345]|uniref:DUF3857 domain-containing protein n=1 Tax=Dyadobacter sp. CY345 TaxID=2909335 RepID=UPI001F39B57B|nr:DUF3857 domain-containing protein [Dyadobacter sp. CY345]MCF2445480.1 DUF3857 and transglutaminase domain-containing protein [Dyadobacter sp. CY345]
MFINFSLVVPHTGIRRLACICVFFALTICNCAFAQEDLKPTYGIVDRASLEMNAYPADSSAEALVLYDFGELRFSYQDHVGLMLIFEYRVRIKILKESALDRASVIIRYGEDGNLERDESITDISGFTYNLVANNIETVAMPKKAIVREKLSDKYWVCKFNLQNVRKGSVIEYTYTKATPFAFRSEPDDWNFQQDIPCKWSEYKITIPNVLYYKITFGGYLPLHIDKRENVNIDIGHRQIDGPGLAYRFVIKDAPAFANESYITTKKDYVSRIAFELASVHIYGEGMKSYSQTWPDVDRTLLSTGSFGGQLKNFLFIKEINEVLAKKTTDPEERMALAYDYIRQNIKWNGETGLVSEEGVKKAFENKKGNVSDINLMLTNLLRQLGLESNPVVLSTRSHGRVIEEIPLIDGFNYVVSHVKLGEKEYLLDATQRNTPLGMLPENALNTKGRLVLNNGKGRFLDLRSKVALRKYQKIDADVSPENGLLKGKYFMTLGGYEALRWRDRYLLEAEENFSEQVKKTNPDWDIDNFRVSNKNEKLGESVEITYDFEAESDGSASDVFYFNPMVAGKIYENPFKALNRIYPVDLTTTSSTTFIGNFKFPEGYYLEQIPQTAIIALPEKAGRFTYQVKQEGNVISVNSVLVINKSYFTASEYELLREFYDRVVEKHAQLLVLKKKK